MKENGSSKTNEDAPTAGAVHASPVAVSGGEYIAREIDSFHRNLDSLATTLPSIVGGLLSASEEEHKRIEGYEKKYAKRVERDEESRTVTMTPVFD